MRRKKQKQGPKAAEQVEFLLEQAAGYEPETEAPDDLVARAMADLPAARASGRKQILAYGACSAAAIAGMGYLTAVMISRGSAETDPASFLKGTLGGSGGILRAEPGVDIQSSPAGPRAQSAQMVNYTGPSGGSEAAQPRLESGTSERPHRSKQETRNEPVLKAQWQNETVEQTTEGVSAPAYVQHEGRQGETVMTPVMIDIPTHSDEKPMPDSNGQGGAQPVDTK
jgi:hypothetical protein